MQLWKDLRVAVTRGVCAVMAGSVFGLTSCHRVNDENLTRPKAVFEISNIQDALSDGRALAASFAQRYHYAVTDWSEPPPLGEKVSLIAESSDGTTVHVFKGLREDRLIVTVFSVDTTPTWQVAACRVHSEIVKRWSEVKLLRGQATLEVILASCDDADT